MPGVPALVAALLACSALLAGCSAPAALDEGTGKVREVVVHVGWDQGSGAPYVRPAQVQVERGERVRLLVTNDDDPATDYNGATPGKGNFHSLALDYPGACSTNPIEHEVPAGVTVATECDGEDHFVADQAGTFTLSCSILTHPSHADLGMNATFVVA